MADKDSNGKEIKLTWVLGPNTSTNYNFSQFDPVQYEQNLLNALDAAVKESQIERELSGSDFAAAKQIIDKIKQNIRGRK